MFSSSLPVFADVTAAAARIAPHAQVTPVLRPQALNALAGASLHFKAEHLQHDGAFKFRGACNAVWALSQTQAARSRGICCHVVVPEGALAAVLVQPERFAGRRVGLILSGGNVDLDALPWGMA